MNLPPPYEEIVDIPLINNNDAEQEHVICDGFFTMTVILLIGLLILYLYSKFHSNTSI